ncbi:MAG: fibronectin type III domain-containing protein [Acidimicrobiales bacterium]
MRWTPPASTGGSAITGYRITVYPSGGTLLRVDSAPAGAASADLTGLTPGTAYVVQVAAVNGTGLGALSGYASNTVLAAFSPTCVGTGDDGPRVQVVLAHTGSAPDAGLLASVSGLTGVTDAFFARSAAATGGQRKVRWRTTAGSSCQLAVSTLAVPAATTTKADVDAALATAGMDQAGRKYFVWIDDTTVTGYRDGCLSSIQPDDQPGPANRNNTATGSSVCPLSWGGGFGPPHELAHQLGAVQPSAPHSDGGYHCTEGYDPLCFGHTTVTNPACANSDVFLYQFDCGFDDYWNTNPAPGSYLCTHWNVARSAFLTDNLAESQVGPPGRPLATGGDGSATVAWTAPTASGCDSVTGYRVTVSPGGATVDVGAGSLSTVVTGLTNGTAYTFTVQALWSNAGAGPASPASDPVTPASPAPAPTFHPIQPARVLDTRPGTTAGLGGAFQGGQSRTLQVAGYGGVPAAGVSAVVLNVTGVAPTQDTFVTLWPSGSPRPLTSNLNLAAGQVTPNLVYVKLSADGKLDLFSNSGSVDLLADVVGWFDEDGSGGRFVGVQPARLLDTRPGTTTGLAGAFGPGQTRTLPIAGRGPVPSAGVTAVVLNVTPVNPTAASFVTLWPSGTTRPLTSNLNLALGAITPNLVTVKVSASGTVDLFNNSGTTDLLADVVGYYADSGGGFTGVQPARLLDTRPGTTVGLSGRFQPGQTRTLQVAGRGPVPASGVTAVVLNVTAVLPSASSFVTLWPSGATRPETSNLNLAAGTVRPNLVVVRLSAGGAVDLYNNSGTTDLLADVVGYFT